MNRNRKAEHLRIVNVWRGSELYAGQDRRDKKKGVRSRIDPNEIG
jgi:hypothetical protein